MATVETLRLSRYTPGGVDIDNVTMAELVAEQKDHGELFARAEDSGCEGMYLEVARWSHDRGRWERYAFVKLLGGEVEGTDAQDNEQVCNMLADLINNAGYLGRTSPIIYGLPPWGQVEDTRPPTVVLLRSGDGQDYTMAVLVPAHLDPELARGDICHTVATVKRQMEDEDAEGEDWTFDRFRDAIEKLGFAVPNVIHDGPCWDY